MLSTQDCYILVIDDEEVNHFLINKALASIELNILHAYNARQGLTLFSENDNIVAIIVDVQMPVEDGFSFVEQLHKANTRCEVPILFMSAHLTDEEDLFKGYKLGGFDYIQHPFYPRILQEKVRLYTELYLSKISLLEQNVALANTVQALHKTREKLLRDFSKSSVSKSALLCNRSSLEAQNRRLQSENDALKERISQYMEDLIVIKSQLNSLVKKET